MANSATVQVQHAISSISRLAARSNPSLMFPNAVRDIVTIQSMCLTLDLPFRTKDSDLWRQAIKSIGGSFDTVNLTWTITLNPNRVEVNTLLDIFTELNSKGVIKAADPIPNAPMLSKFEMNTADWVYPEVLLSTSFDEKDRVLRMFPRARWNAEVKKWSVPFHEIKGTIMDTGEIKGKVIDDNGWFAGVVSSARKTAPAFLIHHCDVKAETSTQALHKDEIKTTVVMSLHPCRSRNNVVYVTVFPSSGKATTPVQISIEESRILWKSLMVCGYKTNPNLTASHVSVHKVIVDSIITPEFLIKNNTAVVTTPNTTHYALNA